MSLIISLGSNLGDKLQNFKVATKELQQFLQLEFQSKVYHSKAVDFEDQPDFFNQVLQFQEPDMEARELIKRTMEIEKKMGRQRVIDKGPRIIDIDILFWGTRSLNDKVITIPHPRLFTRSFICLPLKELPYYRVLKEHYDFPEFFTNSAFPV